MMQSLTPNLMVEDVRKTVAFYERLGFDLRMAVPEDSEDFHDELTADDRYVYAQVVADDVELMFQEAENFGSDLPTFEDAEIGASLTLYVTVDDVDALYESIADGVEVLREPTETWYGMRECYVRDPDGYVLGFGEEPA